MREGRLPKDRLKMSKFKLDALLDITLSINANLPTAELLRKYESILRDELGIGKILLFKYGEQWEPLLNSGFPESLKASVDVENDLLCFREIQTEVVQKHFRAVDFIIPVLHNNEPSAYVLIGDIDEEGEGMSPLIKHLNFIQTISGIIVVAIENQRLFRESLRQEALRRELELAARMQMMLIPDNTRLPSDNLIRAKGFYYPHYEVGGDYYDFMQLSENVAGFCIADVSGKGMSAALLMSNFQASLRALFTAGASLEELIRTLNTLVVTNSAGERFITLFIARYNTETRELEYINAAHNPPVIINTRTGQSSLLRQSCVGVGMLDEIPCVRTETLTLKNPTKIICYTDGLSELKDDGGRDYGIAPLVKHFPNGKPLAENIESLIRDIDISSNNQRLFDDVSILAVEIP
ncbi:MAG TPA: PP2C family protein-serine/threonine phosphatase [Bacteroidales bacterium]|jgi:sigma-B regulation protein RsbU (phosphoserine phosphatase)|nr:PP2C family protein-serine/threonine phosphatase [Bacteroidales bacterium]HPS97461.1 PP2C family protein-serine/threonine phosphatase [Bacteroidales bacterium]